MPGGRLPLPDLPRADRISVLFPRDPQVTVLMPRYNPAVIEPKWQKYWEENHVFAAPGLPDGGKIYVLDMFPYPSGDGLHVGHPGGLHGHRHRLPLSAGCGAAA